MWFVELFLDGQTILSVNPIHWKMDTHLVISCHGSLWQWQILTCFVEPVNDCELLLLLCEFPRGYVGEIRWASGSSPSYWKQDHDLLPRGRDDPIQLLFAWYAKYLVHIASLILTNLHPADTHQSSNEVIKHYLMTILIDPDEWPAEQLGTAHPGPHKSLVVRWQQGAGAHPSE